MVSQIVDSDTQQARDLLKGVCVFSKNNLKYSSIHASLSGESAGLNIGLFKKYRRNTLQFVVAVNVEMLQSSTAS